MYADEIELARSVAAASTDLIALYRALGVVRTRSRQQTPEALEGAHRRKLARQCRAEW